MKICNYSLCRHNHCYTNMSMGQVIFLGLPMRRVLYNIYTSLALMGDRPNSTSKMLGHLTRACTIVLDAMGIYNDGAYLLYWVLPQVSFLVRSLLLYPYTYYTLYEPSLCWVVQPPLLYLLCVLLYSIKSTVHILLSPRRGHGHHFTFVVALLKHHC